MKIFCKAETSGVNNLTPHSPAPKTSAADRSLQCFKVVLSLLFFYAKPFTGGDSSRKQLFDLQ